MNILEELWYGNIYPNEQSIRKDSEYAQALRKVADEKESLLACPRSCKKGLKRFWMCSWKRR